MRKFTTVLGNGKEFKYYYCVVPDSISDGDIIKMCKELHPDMFGADHAKEIKRENMELVAIVSIDLFIKMPIAALYYPDKPTDVVYRALDILLDAAGVQ